MAALLEVAGLRVSFRTEGGVLRAIPLCARNTSRFWLEKREK